MSENLPVGGKAPDHPLFPDDPTRTDITITLTDVALPRNEADREEVVEQLVLYWAACLRSADPGFNAGWGDAEFEIDLERTPHAEGG